MYLSIVTTHNPATDLGFLLHKHPDRVHETDLSFGKAHLFYPEATVERCEAVLLLEIDPVGLVRGRGSAEGVVDQYVNDRPYAASSFLSVALIRSVKTAMAGISKDRPELAAAPMPLEARISPCPRAAARPWCASCSNRWAGPSGSSPSPAPTAKPARAISA